MRLAYERYSGPRGFTASQFRATAQEIAGIDLSSWFHRVLETTEELDYTEALDWLGLRFAKDEKKNKDSNKPPKAWLGLVTRNEEGRPAGQPGQARHARIRGGFQCGRRDPGHRR